MKITDVRTLKLVGPRLHSMGGATGEIGKVIVRVDTDAGHYGLGEADNFLGVGDAIDYLRVLLIGQDPFRVRPFVSEAIFGSLAPHSATQRAIDEPAPLGGTLCLTCSPTATPSGPIVWGASAVEMALCDIVGKALKTPVYNLLGGRFRERARVYLDRSAPQEVDNLDAWKKLGADSVGDGFGFLKFDADYTAWDLTQDVWNRSLSTSQLDRIVKRIGAVRETVGPDIEIAIDLHRLYNTSDAIRLAQELIPLKLRWLEDPTPLVNPDACAEVRRKTAIPICVGEMFTAEECRTFIDHGACDIIHPDVMFCGGLHEAMRIASYAELHYLPMAMHGNGGSLATVAAAHVAVAARNFLGLEYHHIETDWINNMVRREGVSLFEDGYLPLTDAPGLGVELDRDVCRRFAANGEFNW